MIEFLIVRAGHGKFPYRLPCCSAVAAWPMRWPSKTQYEYDRDDPRLTGVFRATGHSDKGV